MKRLFFLSLLFLGLLVQGLAAQSNVAESLASLPGVSDVKPLKSDVYANKFVLNVRQFVDPKDTTVGTFQQRVIVSHVGFDRPTVFVTEGYNADYALSPRYQEELCTMLNANMIFVEYRYFGPSTPKPCNWDYLTAENSAYDLHRLRQLFGELYHAKWISTGVSKGGQTTTLYRAFFPDDVDFSVAYVAPLNHGIQDGRHEGFIARDGSRAVRKKIFGFQKEILKRRAAMLPMLEQYSEKYHLTYRIPTVEILDYCVLEYSFAFWQWGTDVNRIPSPKSDDKTLFAHLIDISGPFYWSESQPFAPFAVQAVKELGYYGYDLKPFKRWLTIKSIDGYMDRLMVPKEVIGKYSFDITLYNKVYNFLRDNDPKIIFIYGQHDPWSASRVPTFKDKRNEQIFIQPKGSHASRIGNMPENIRKKITTQINLWMK